MQATPANLPGSVAFLISFEQEKWHSSDPLQESVERRKKHVALGTAYAALGHEGRRVTIPLHATPLRVADSVLRLAIRPEGMELAKRQT